MTRARLPLRAERAAFWSTVAAVCVVVVLLLGYAVIVADGMVAG